jgi:antitoxin (DNA-binding transcriptional repressor) of toxin-antitoxin stability system
MYVAKIDDAQQLDDLVKQAESGEEVVLYRADKAVAKIVVLGTKTELQDPRTEHERRLAIQQVRKKAREKSEAEKRSGIAIPTYQQIIDDMYDEDGLPK